MFEKVCFIGLGLIGASLAQVRQVGRKFSKFGKFGKFEIVENPSFKIWNPLKLRIFQKFGV